MQRRGNNRARCIFAAISLSVGLCVCGALKIRANDRRAFSVSLARVPARSSRKRNATTLSDSGATRRRGGFCAFSMFMFIGAHVQGVL